MNNLIEKIRSQLKLVLDPELGINVVDLGLIYRIDVPEEGVAHITMTLTTPGCPLHDSITSGVKYAILRLDEINHVDVNLVWEPAWTPEMMNEEVRKSL